MRLSVATITSNIEVRTGIHLIEMLAPQLAQAVQPGQYCMVRCCDTDANDPLLRRPLFVRSVQRGQGLCSLLVSIRGRGTSWLAKQQEGAALDILGPLGHGWTVRPTVRNLLLVGEEEYILSSPNTRRRSGQCRIARMQVNNSGQKDKPEHHSHSPRLEWLHSASLWPKEGCIPRK